MNLKNFHSKALDLRAAIVGRKGIFLASCNRVAYQSNLYFVNGCFAEVWFERKRKEIILIRGFTGLRSLTPYLNQVDLKDIQSLLD